MKLNFPLLYLSVHLVFVNCFTNDLGEVVFVSILFRHGDRTPIEPYPNDPYKNNSLWPADWGELTNVGKKGHYELGKWLRQRYGSLLPKSYKKEDIYIRSTDVDRTLMSAYSNLAGLYEPDIKSNWDSNIDWTPIPVHTVPQKLDKVLAAEAPCTKYNIELNNLKNTPEFQSINAKNKKLYNYLAKHTGANVTSVSDVERIYDTLFIEDLYKFKLPNWTKSVYPQPMKQISEFTFSIPCYHVSLARLKVGPLLKEIVTHMSEKISNEKIMKQKAWIYSAHDTTVANVLKALNLFEPHCPPYYSLILFELRKKNQDYFVAIHYKNSTTSPPYFMQLKHCDKLCPFDKFKKNLFLLLPDDWEEECQAIKFIENNFDQTAIATWLISVLLMMMFSCSLIYVYNYFHKRQAIIYKSLKMDVSL